MQTTIEYLATSRFEDTFEVESVGDISLEAYNDTGFKWLLDIKTEGGFTTVLQFGPIDIQTNLPDDYSFSYSKFKIEYNEKKLVKVLKDFANNPRRVITQVLEITHSDFYTFLDKIRQKF